MPSDPPPPPPGSNGAPLPTGGDGVAGRPPGHGDGVSGGPPGHATGAPSGSAALDAAVRRFSQPRRLHPASVVLGVNIRQLVQALIFPAAVTFTAGGRVMLVVLLVAAVVGLVARTLAWQRFHFSFDGEVLRVAEGVVSRNQRALDVARIQQVEIDRSLLQRMLGLAALRVETAGSSSEVEVELRVVPEDDAVALRSALRESKARAAGGPAPAEEADGPRRRSTRREIRRVPLRHVVLASVTGVRLLVFPAVIAGAFQLLGQATDDWIEAALQRLLEQGLVADNGLPELTLGTGLLIAAVVLGLSLVTAIVVGVLRDANFRIERVDDDLHVSRGLLSTRDSVLPLRRIQLVEIQRNWLRRLLGYSAMRVHSAGGSGDADRRVTVPLLADRHVDSLVAELYPGSPGVPQLRSHPRAAVRRAVFRWLRAMAVPVVAVWVVPWDRLEAVRVPALGLLALAVVLGVVEYRHLAHGVDRIVVASRQGALSVSTSLAPLVKVQAVSTRANWFQRRLRLATVRSHVAGPGADVVVLDTGARTAEELQDRLTRYAADPAWTPPSGSEDERQTAAPTAR